MHLVISKNEYCHVVDFVSTHGERGVAFSVLFWSPFAHSQVSLKHITYSVRCEKCVYKICFAAPGDKLHRSFSDIFI